MLTPHPRKLRYAAKNIKALEANSAFQASAHHALSLYNTSAVYTYIPKNACSTLRFSLALANGCVTGIEDIEWIHANNATFRASLAELVTAKYTFVVLRDPFRRLLSCFYDKIVGRTKIMKQFIKQSGRTTEPEQLTFREFVTLLPPLISSNSHWRPQIDFLAYDNYDDWFCVEEFDKAIIKLNERIGLHIVDTRQALQHDTSSMKFARKASAGPDTTIVELAEMKGRGYMPRPSAMFDGDVLKRIRMLYHDDINLYKEKIRLPLMY